MAEIFRMPIQHAGKGACSIEWEPTERDRKRAIKNHGQTLERLAQRGGMDWGEMDAILSDLDWGKINQEGAQLRCNAEIERRSATAVDGLSTDTDRKAD